MTYLLVWGTELEYSIKKLKFFLYRIKIGQKWINLGQNWTQKAKTLLTGLERQTQWLFLMIWSPEYEFFIKNQKKISLKGQNRPKTNRCGPELDLKTKILLRGLERQTFSYGFKHWVWFFHSKNEISSPEGKKGAKKGLHWTKIGPKRSKSW